MTGKKWREKGRDRGRREEEGREGMDGDESPISWLRFHICCLLYTTYTHTHTHSLHTPSLPSVVLQCSPRRFPPRPPRSRAAVCSAALQPPAVHHVLLRDHRTTKVHGAFARGKPLQLLFDAHLGVLHCRPALPSTSTVISR